MKAATKAPAAAVSTAARGGGHPLTEHALLGSSSHPAEAPDAPPAACRRPDVDPDLFFPGAGQSVDPGRAVCLGCPLRTRCGEWAIPQADLYGIWGALTAKDRRRIRRERSGVRP